MSKNTYANVSFGNSKLGRAIASINMPAVVTCREGAPCYNGCYARKGRWLFQNVKDSLQENLDAYKADPNKFFNSVTEQTALCKYARFFSSGDIPDAEFFKGMCKVARKNKDTKYLCFTKKYEIVNDFVAAGHRIPKNLSIVFSAWSDWMPENPYNFPMTYVYGKGFNNELIPDNAIPCAGKCYECQACWQLKKGQTVFFKKH